MPSTRCRCRRGAGPGFGKALKIIVQPVRERIPIYIASLGTKNVEMTAELAEGWLPLHYWPERAGDLWGDALATGTAKRASDLPPLEVVAGGSLAIGNDVEGLRDSPGRRSPSTSAAWVARGSERRARRGDAGVLVATASIDA